MASDKNGNTNFPDDARARLLKHLGAQLRKRREELGLSRRDLETFISGSPGIVAKFESGSKDISAGQLYVLCRKLRVDVEYFYDGYAGEEIVRKSPRDAEILKFVKAYHSVSNADVRKSFYDLIKATSRRKKS
jgi:transcriptional regulator with XRE-family HTH domain